MNNNNTNKNILQYNNKFDVHGYWEIYTYNILYYKRFHHNGKLIGYEEFYPYSTSKVEKRFHII
jgi:hypothetical protein